jgi:nitroreductase
VLTSAAISTVIATAARAPSVHNTQPWKFQVVGDAIELHADPDRQLAQIDPVGRELTISCGAALFGLRLGLRQLGSVPAVQLWPDPARPWLVARVWPAGQMPTNKIEAELIAAVPHRHTHRGPFSPGEVSPRLLAALAVDADAEGAELWYVEQPDAVRELAALVDRATAEQEGSPDISAETSRWVRPVGSEARDGVPEPATAAGTQPTALRFRQREFGATTHAPAGRVDAADITGEPPAATAVLVTDGDTADDWLRAGQALDRLLLRAATRWVFASLHSQPLESPRYRKQVRELLSMPGQPQMLLQFGRSNTALATPRRRHAEFRTNENQA